VINGFKIKYLTWVEIKVTKLKKKLDKERGFKFPASAQMSVNF